MFQMKEQEKTSENKQTNKVKMRDLSDKEFKVMTIGSSLAVQWLRLGTFIAMSFVQILVRELISHKLCGTDKKTVMNVMMISKYVRRINEYSENFNKEKILRAEQSCKTQLK